MFFLIFYIPVHLVKWQTRGGFAPAGKTAEARADIEVANGELLKLGGACLGKTIGKGSCQLQGVALLSLRAAVDDQDLHAASPFCRSGVESIVIYNFCLNDVFVLYYKTTAGEGQEKPFAERVYNM